MNIRRSFTGVLSSLLVIILLSIILPGASTAQQAADNSMAMPISFVLGSALDDHEQDIMENIFEYKFDAARSDPARQSGLVWKRSNELKSVANSKKAFLQALMEKNGTIPDGQIAGMAYSVGISVDKLNGWSKKLEEHAAGLTLLNGHKTYEDNVLPLFNDIKDAKGLSDKLKKDRKY